MRGKKKEVLDEQNYIISRKDKNKTRKEKKEEDRVRKELGSPMDASVLATEPMSSEKPETAPAENQRQSLAPEKKDNDHILKRYQDFEKEINSLEINKKSLLSYLESQGRFRLVYGEDEKGFYFPGYIKKIRDVLKGDLDINKLNEIPALYDKTLKIIESKKEKQDPLDLKKEKKDAKKTSGLSDEEKDRKIAEFFGKETTGAITEAPLGPEKGREKILEKKEKPQKEEEPKEISKNENLLNLEKEVEEARKNFVEMDMDAEKKSSKMWKFFRIGNLGEYGEEHKRARERYYTALKAYKNEYFNVHGLSEKSAREMVTFFNIKEYYNLESMRQDKNNQNIGWTKKIWNGYLGLIERYKKIGENDKSKLKKYSKKIAAGMFVAGSATALAAGGAMIAGTIGSMAGALLVRGFTVGVSSGGFDTMYEGWAQGSKERKNKRELEYISHNLKEPSAEESYFDQISQNLDEKIDSIDEVLQKQKQWKRFRALAAIGTAMAISQAGRYFGHWISEKMNHWLNGAELPALKKGESIEKSLIKYFTDNPNLVEKYNEQFGRGRKFNAGQIAHRMFEEYEDKRDLVHPGARVQLSPDGLHIRNVVGDENMGFLSKNITEGVAFQSELQADAASENLVQVPDSFVNPESSSFGKNIANVIGGLNKEIKLNEFEIDHPQTHDAEKALKFKETVAELGNSRNFLVNFREWVFRGDARTARILFQDEISLNHKWDNIKDMTFREAVSSQNLNWRTNEKIKTIFKCLKNVLGDEIKPGDKETLEKWTERVSRLAVEKAK